MDFISILTSIEDFSIEKKNTIEDILLLHPTLSLDDPLTYMIYLSHIPDVSAEEKDTIYQIIEKLNKNQKNMYNAAYKESYECCRIEEIQDDISLNPLNSLK